MDTNKKGFNYLAEQLRFQKAVMNSSLSAIDSYMIHYMAILKKIESVKTFWWYA